MNESDNIYLRMPMRRVRADATNGVLLAIRAWRRCEPEAAGRALGRVVELSASPGNDAVTEQPMINIGK